MPSGERDRLFGKLALHNGLIDRSQYDDATRAHDENPSRSLADHLSTRAGLDHEQRTAVDALVTCHLKKHSGNLEQTIASLADARHDDETMAAPEAEEPLRLDHRADPASGRCRFRILRPHAKGGLGAVSVAMDEELHREVALKQILDHHAEDSTSRARFLLEAEITGGLEHPGIVPVYGMGRDEQGRLYYAMRFIRGETLKDTIDRFHQDAALRADPGRRSLEFRKLLRRFIDICNSIEYAHSRGILHRDMKPANVIVGKHGETLVVDWGLAKVIGGDDLPDMESDEKSLMPSTASGSAETLPGRTLGTPAFMSPEQAEGDLERLGPRSDVYSLGATLYYLLTGRPPVEGRVREMLDAVKKADIKPPRQVDPTIDPALDAICRKAMSHRTGDRYGSARLMSDDIDRWMADEPVSAWHEPVLRRVRRWAKRHQTPVAAAAVGVVAIVFGLSAVLAIQTHAKAQIAHALENETKASRALAAGNAALSRSKAAVQTRYDLAVDAIRTFHTGVSEDFLLKEEKFNSLRDRLLRSAEDFYGKLGDLLGQETDPASRRALASANFELAGLTAKVGHTDDALLAHRAVLKARRELADEPKAGAPSTIDVGRSLVEIANLLELDGQNDAALASYQEAVKVLSPIAKASPEAREILADCRSRMGYFLSTIGKNDEALTAYRQAREDQEALVSSPGASSEIRRELGDTINRIGRLLANIGKPKEAEAAYREALEIRRKLANEHPDRLEYRDGLAASHNNIGLVLWKSGRHKDAETEFRTALDLWASLARANPAVNEFRKQLQVIYVNLGNLLRETGRVNEAEASFREALTTLQRLVEDNPKIPDFRRRLALVHHNLGLVLKSSGNVDAAERAYREALTIQAKIVAEHPDINEYASDLASTHSELGVLLAESGRLTSAEAEFRASTEVGRKLVDANPKVTVFRDRLATGHVNLGELLSEAGRATDADPEYREAQTLFRELAEANPTVSYYRFGLAYTHNRRGILLTQAQRFSEAESECREAASIYRALSEASPKVPDYRDGLAGALTSLGDAIRPERRFTAARDAYDRAIALREELVAQVPRAPLFRISLSASLRRRGLARAALGDLAGSSDDTRKALAILDGLKTRAGTEWFEAACCHAALGETGPAMDGLRKAVALGYRNIDAIQIEAALDGLRDRGVFRLLMMDIAMPAEPIAPAPGSAGGSSTP